MVNTGQVALISGVFAVVGIALGRSADAVFGALARRSYLREKREDAYYQWLVVVTRMALTYRNLMHASAARAEQAEALSRVIDELESKDMREVWAKIRLFGRPEAVNASQQCVRRLRSLYGEAEKTQISFGDFNDSFMACLSTMRRDVGTHRRHERLDPAGISLGIGADHQAS